MTSPNPSCAQSTGECSYDGFVELHECDAIFICVPTRKGGGTTLEQQRPSQRAQHNRHSQESEAGLKTE